MKKLIKQHATILTGLLLFLYTNTQVQAQMLEDEPVLDLLKTGVDCIYNCEFSEANEIYISVKESYPKHPIAFLYRGLMTYWENYPLLADSPARASFENDMFTCMDLCEQHMMEDQFEAEYLMANLAARGLLLLFYADNDISMEVFSVASSTYKYVRRAFEYLESYPDFYFITGLYNYYREAYPEAHPIYKPIAFIFPKGDKITGLRDLNTAANQAIFLKAEAYSFLSGIYISFENDFQYASQYSKTLSELYPDNPLYLAIYLKNLLLTENYDEAQKLINASRYRINNELFHAQITILEGILYEKKYGNLPLAQTYYENGIKATEKYAPYADEFTAYGYFGLSRISAENNNNQMRRNFRKQALDLTHYENVNFD